MIKNGRIDRDDSIYDYNSTDNTIINQWTVGKSLQTGVLNSPSITYSAAPNSVSTSFTAANLLAAAS